MAFGVENITSNVVMETKGLNISQLPSLVIEKHNSSLKSKGLSNGDKCTQYGNSRHVHNRCFKLHRYLEWWHELQAKKKRDITTLKNGTGKVVVVTIESQLSNIPPPQ
ncbi:unnamed protein product [Lathyrus sativus]|nr:unnamed protein product [Lathyrus sativus]